MRNLVIYTFISCPNDYKQENVKEYKDISALIGEIMHRVELSPQQ